MTFAKGKLVSKKTVKKETVTFRVYTLGEDGKHTAVRCFEAVNSDDAAHKASLEGIKVSLVKRHLGKVGKKGEPLNYANQRGIDPRGGTINPDEV